ncbi:MAG TPA: TonB-dependent receptor [Usitatibacter sp.]|nr:TonB-dependent receptor [Usitatibacter sp.]
MKRILAGSLAFAGATALAQERVAQEPVVVSATRSEVRLFDAPAAIGTVDADTISAAGPQVNLSESLSRIPGIAVLNRQNYAQDLQLSIRGFGSRSTFGIRGVRLIVDGIPATTPDGQGQASSIALTSAARIEVLRGPLALLYGNAAGGVVQVFTQDGAPQPTFSASAAAGSWGLRREDLKYAATSGAQSFVVDGSRFDIDGYRDHSSATRSLGNARWTWRPADSTRISVVVNVLDQPEGLDALGLTHAQWDANPRQTQPIAIQEDTHKNLRQSQAGAVAEHWFDPDTSLSARIYYGERKIDNALGIPLGAQQAATSAGGIVAFARDYSGASLQLSRRVALAGPAAARFTAGFDYDRMHDDRQGYLNVNGARGDLKRNEDDYVHNADGLLMGTLDFGDAWSAIAGVRSSHVHFETHDHYIAPGNPDDSGSIRYGGTNPVAGVTWHADPALNVYANAGRGFETPTFTELAYRNNASGLNTDLKAAHGKHLELGAKWRGQGQSLDVAAYQVRTDDELIVDTNTGGRSTFRNAGPTLRRGIEAAYTARIGEEWRAQVSATAMRARFDQSFASGSGTAAVPVASGNRLPGTPEREAFGELAYAPRRAWAGFNAAIEVVHVGRIYVDDANSDFAPAATVVNLRAGWKHRWGALEIAPLLRLDNAANRRYAGSVIVNEANRRFFEPAPTRSWLAAITGRYTF